MKDTAVKWDLEKFVKYNSRVTDSVWDDDKGKWMVKIDTQGTVIEDQCDVLINASGFLKYAGDRTSCNLADKTSASGHGPRSKGFMTSKASSYTLLHGKWHSNRARLCASHV
jgi:hypothetical protein